MNAARTSEESSGRLVASRCVSGLRRDRELCLVDRQQLGHLHLGRIVQIKPRDIGDVLLEPKVELVLRLHEFGKRLLEVLALDVDHRGAATVDWGNPRNFLRDPESLL